MFFSVLSFLAGIVVVQQFSTLPTSFLAYLFLLAIGCTYWRYWRLLFFILGVSWAIFYADVRIQHRLIEQFAGQSIPIEGEVIGLPQHNDRSVRFDFLIAHSQTDNPQLNNIKKIRLNWYTPKQPIKAGQYWRLTVKLKKPHGTYNPDSFDYERWLFTQNIGATGYVKNKPLPQLITTTSIFKHSDNIRQLIADKLENLPVKSENIGLIKALVIGDKSAITDKQWTLFKETGTVHLLAISGLHIGLIASLTFLLTLKINIALGIMSPQMVAALSAITVAIFYAALAGFSLPTQRALLMLIIVMVAIIWQRNTQPINTLAIALLAVLIVDPLAVLTVGFWLSFLAVMLIIYVMAGRLRGMRYWHSAIKINGIVAIGLSPLLLFYFQQTSIVSPFANLLAAPIVGMLVVPLCLFGVVVLFVSPLLAAFIFAGADTILQWVIWFLTHMASSPFATVLSHKPSFYAVALAMFGVFLLFSPKGIPARWLAVVLLFPLLFQNPQKPKSGAMDITVLDVGQGLSVVVQTRNHLLVFDTGAKYSNKYDAGRYIVMPFLRNKSIKKIDTLVISHADNDHMGGAASILKQISVKKILASAPKQLAPTDATHCQAGQSWVWDDVLFEMLQPPIHRPNATNKANSNNNNSCVLKISSQQLAVLLTGDIEKEAEQHLIKQGDRLKSAVLIAPHHGSKTSSTLAFLQFVDPDVVLVSAGYKNRFSFPHQSVLARYKKMNIAVFNTATAGALSVKVENNLAVVESMRAKHRKYWHDW